MSWKLFGQIVLLIVIFAFTVTGVKCMHDACCKKCPSAMSKTPPLPMP